MARTTIAVQTPLPVFKPYYPATLPLPALSADLVFTGNTDPTDRSTPLIADKTMIVAMNSDTVAHTISIGSSPDSLFRKGDITAYSVAAGKVAVFGPFPSVGWSNAGVLQIDVSDPKLLLSAITLP